MTKVEHKFANMQTSLSFLSTLVLKDHSKWRTNKNKHGERDNVHPNVHSERKILTHHEIIDRIAERIVSVITQLDKEITAKFFIYLFI